MPLKQQDQGNDKTTLKRGPHQFSNPASEGPASQAFPTLIFTGNQTDPRLLAPQDILQLQRAIGNGAVEQLLAKTTRPQSVQAKPQDNKLDNRCKPDHGGTLKIQRKVGFEAELSVPTLLPPGPLNANLFKNKPEGRSATSAIQQFLFGGLPYGMALGKGPHFELKSDHDDLQRGGEAIASKLSEMGYINLKGRTISNLEYVTQEIDELSPKSTTAFNQQFEAIRAHAHPLLTTARTQVTPITPPAVGNVHTGVPVGDFQTWLGQDYDQVRPLIEKFQNLIQDKFYLQATVGIIPSALRDLHKRYTPNHPQETEDVLERAMWGVNRMVDVLVKQSSFQDNSFIKSMSPIDHEAFQGVLHLIAMYIVGSALNQTPLSLGATVKNAVPFLSKLKNMGDIVNTATTPYLRNNRPPEDLINFINTVFKKFPFTRGEYWLEELPEEQRNVPLAAPIVPPSFVSDVLKGGKIEAITDGRTFSKPDELPGEVSELSGGQQAPQFEYRQIKEEPDANGLAVVLKKIVDEVRLLNTKHIPEPRRSQIIAAADQ